MKNYICCKLSTYECEDNQGVKCMTGKECAQLGTYFIEEFTCSNSNHLCCKLPDIDYLTSGTMVAACSHINGSCRDECLDNEELMEHGNCQNANAKKCCKDPSLPQMPALPSPEFNKTMPENKNNMTIEDLLEMLN